MMEQRVHYCTIPSSVTAFAHISTRSGYRIISVLCSSAPTYMPLLLCIGLSTAVMCWSETCNAWLFHSKSERVVWN